MLVHYCCPEEDCSTAVETVGKNKYYLFILCHCVGIFANENNANYGSNECIRFSAVCVPNLLHFTRIMYMYKR